VIAFLLFSIIKFATPYIHFIAIPTLFHTHYWTIVDTSGKYRKLNLSLPPTKSTLTSNSKYPSKPDFSRRPDPWF